MSGAGIFRLVALSKRGCKKRRMTRRLTQRRHVESFFEAQAGG